MPITRATNLAGLGTIFDSLTDGGGLSVSGISTFTDLNITRVNITGVGTITNGSITNLTGTSSTITTFTSTTGNFTTGNIVTGVTTNFNATNVAISGVTTVSAGTALLPSISPSGDSNTGIFFPAADTVNVSTGGSERLRITSSGNVGIGTTNPQYETHLYGNKSSDVAFVITNKNATSPARAYIGLENDIGGTAAISFGSTAYNVSGPFRPSGLTIFTSSAGSSGGIAIAARNTAGYIDFYTGGNNPRAIIDASGNVGIGTINPPTKFFAIEGSSSIGFAEYGNGAILWMDGSNGDLTGGDYWGLWAKSSTLWGVSYAGGSLNFCVTSSGNVGVGTDNPATRLHVAGGNIKVDSGYGIDFSATSDSAGKIDEVLDDYERGTWTPTFTGGTGSVSRSSYIKVGRLVTCSLSFSLTSRTSSSFSFTLPFTSDISTSGGGSIGVESHGSVMMNSINTTPTNGLFATVYIWNSSGEIYWTVSGGGGWVQAAGTNMGSSNQTTFSYFAAS